MAKRNRVLSLTEALAKGRLDEFIQEQEAEYGPTSKDELDSALSKAIKRPQSTRRTSRSS